ncbi:MAG: hypothetical protein ABI638_00655 [Ignavibacteriota bacterium]
MQYKNFEELLVWILSREIINLVYETIRKSDGLKKELRNDGCRKMFD